MSAQIVNFRPNGEHGWTGEAACGGPTPPNMFPADGDTRGTGYAKSFCRACPVRFECLTEALEAGESFGIWGGLTGEERTAIRRAEVRRATRDARERLTSAELAADIMDAEVAPEPVQPEPQPVRTPADDFNEMLDAAHDYMKALANA